MDDVLIWDRHLGGHARCGPVQRQLPMLVQPVMGTLHIEALDYRPGLVSLIREHACGWREMHDHEQRACDVYLRAVGAGGVR